MKTIGMKTIGMKTQAIKVKLRDGEMGAYVAIPDRTPAGAVIAIMESGLVVLTGTQRNGLAP